MGDGIERQIRLWKLGAIAELKPVKDLLATGNARQALFWAHLSVEKALKAHVTRVTRKTAPFTHSLIRLVELTDLSYEFRAGRTDDSA